MPSPPPAPLPPPPSKRAAGEFAKHTKAVCSKLFTEASHRTLFTAPPVIKQAGAPAYPGISTAGETPASPVTPAHFAKL